MKKLGCWMLVMAMAGFVAACGGSSGGTSGSSSDSTETASTISSLSDVPLSVVDPSQFVAASSASASISKSYGDTGTFSVAGCIADRMKRNVLRNAILPKMILCYTQKISEANSLTPGNNAYNYLAISSFPKGPDQLGGSMDMRVALGNFTDANGNPTLKMAMCLSPGGVGSYAKAIELVVQEQSASHWSGSVVQEFVAHGDYGASQEKLTFDADGLAFDSAGLPTTFTTATFNQLRNEDQWGYHEMGIESAKDTNIATTVHGRQDDNYMGNDIVRRMYAKFDASSGKAVFAEEGTQPGVLVGSTAAIDQNWHQWLTMPVSNDPEQPGGLGLADTDYICMIDHDPWIEVAQGTTCPVARDGSESFTINGTETTDLLSRFLIGTSTYDDVVSTANLPSSDVQTIAFALDVFATSCEADFVQSVDLSTIDLTTCDAMQEDMNKWQDEGDCWQKMNQNRD